MTLAILAAALALCVGCTFTDSSEEVIEVAGPPPDPSALTTRDDPSPKYVSKAEVGSDIRYILSYRGRAVHIFAGESGLLGVKVLADRGETTWDSLWLTFSPRAVRPRAHSADELAPEGQINLDYVPEGFRGYVQDAQQLALYLAPQTPRAGEEAASPPPARAVITKVNLPPIAANELAIFARTAKLTVTQNLKIPAHDVPAKLSSKGNIRFDECVSNVSYVQSGAWASFKLVLRNSHSIYYIVRDQPERYTTYVEVYKHIPKKTDEIVLEQLITVDGGTLSIDYYEPVAGDPIALSNQVRMASGIALSMIDEGVLEPPEDFKKEFIVTAALLVDRENANDFEVEREGPRGTGPILQQLEGAI